MIGAILIGGKSQRKGSDKSKLELNGISLLERTKALLGSEFEDVILIGKEEDIFKGIGAIGGLHSAIKKANGKACFVLACDYPGINAGFISFMKAEYNETYDVVFPEWGDKVQTLCGIYGPGMLSLIELQIKTGDHKIQNLIKKCRVKLVRLGKKHEFYSDSLLVNMNTPGDYEQFKAKD
jgi:molybdopterin-guanine dinucleotide biosynthesis protein A